MITESKTTVYRSEKKLAWPWPYSLELMGRRYSRQTTQQMHRAGCPRLLLWRRCDVSRSRTTFGKRANNIGAQRKICLLPHASSVLPMTSTLSTKRSERGSGLGTRRTLLQTCDDDAPHLLTHAETTQASVTDDAVAERIHEALQEKQLLPETHVVDTGYLDAKLLVESQQTRCGLIYWGRRERIIIGRPAKGKDLPPSIFWSIGSSSM